MRGYDTWATASDEHLLADDEETTVEMSADDAPDWWHFEQAIEREREAGEALAKEADYAILWGGLDMIALERLRAALDAYNEAKAEHHYS
jgi:hypothetical protein